MGGGSGGSGGGVSNGGGSGGSGGGVASGGGSGGTGGGVSNGGGSGGSGGSVSNGGGSGGSGGGVSNGGGSGGSGGGGSNGGGSGGSGGGVSNGGGSGGSGGGFDGGTDAGVDAGTTDAGAPATYTIGGTITGLTGAGLVLQNNLGDSLVVAAGLTSFTFATALANGAMFSVSVKTHPTSPVQQCSVSMPSGTVSGANVTTVAITCNTVPFYVGGTLTGLAANQSVKLANGADAVTLTMDGPFNFPLKVPSGSSYDAGVTLQPQSPISQTCAVANGAGLVTNADVSSIGVTCDTNSFLLNGRISNLAANDTLPIRLNSSTIIAVASDGGSPLSYGFAVPLPSGTPWTLDVPLQPTSPVSQQCTPAVTSGTVGGGDVDAGLITCVTNPFALNVTVIGLGASPVVLTRGVQDLTVVGNGTVNFSTPLLSGTSYTVTVKTQPTDRVCTVNSGSGTIGNAAATVLVNCSPFHTVGGTVSGLVGSGLVLRNNGGNDLTITSDGSFTFTQTLADGSSYNVLPAAQPTTPWQTCVVANGGGLIAGADVTTVTVTCTTNTYSIGGALTGLAVGSSLGVALNDGGTTTLSSGSSYSLLPKLNSGATYNVRKVTDPASPSQTCTVANASGTVTNANVTNANISCVNNYSIGGTVTGLAGTGLLLRLNGGNDLIINANGSFTFPTKIPFGSSYAVTVQTNPADYVQVCTPSLASGTVPAGNVTGVMITCATPTAIKLSVNFAGSGKNIGDGTSSSCTTALPSTPGLTSAISVPNIYFTVKRVIVRLKNLNHTFAGDVTATLSHADSSTTRVGSLVSRLGVSVSDPCGSKGNYLGGYDFLDASAGILWSTAHTTGAIDTTSISPGSYYPTTDTGTRVYLNNNATTDFLNRVNAGTWTLRLYDSVQFDVGTIDGWTLELYNN